MARSNHRSRYSDADRTARALENEALRRATEEDLADPEKVAQRIRQAIDAGMRGRVMRYSLRNVLTLLHQANERGMTLTDVDTYKGWQARGRQVRRGENALRIRRPIGRENDDAEDSQTNDDVDADEATPSRKAFRMAPRFDISQTDAGTHDDEDDETPCPACAAAPGEPCTTACTCFDCTGTSDPAQAAEPPAEALWNSLVEQLARTGYRLNWPAPADKVGDQLITVDHAARTVHVALWATAGNPAAVVALGVAVAAILTAASAARRTPAAAITAN